jgi:iron complex outermembrane receptor protein
MIQGLHSNRIVIVNNNQVLEGQQWGREHAPEIDPFSADRVTVVKGAMGVRYGVGAMAGAIVLEPAPLRATPGWGGWATLGAFTNGRSGVAAAALDYRAPNRPWAVRIQGAAKRGGNLRAPDYFLHNTGHAELNFSALAEWKPNERTTHELALSRFSQQLGILRASHLGSTEQIELAAQLDTPLNNINRFTWAIDRPYQGIQHYSAIYKLQHRINDYWKIRAQYGFQYNYRLEYDVVRRTGAAADRAQVAFQLWTNSADLWVEHRARRYWQGEGGVQLIHFLNNVNRGAFIPNFQTWGASVWAHERWG